MSPNHLRAVSELGQSFWLDFLDRALITSGKLRRYIVDDGLRGMTSNPTIFDKAISGDRAYDADIRELAQQRKTPAQIFEALAIEDIQLAADEFRPVFDRLDGRDGFVSLEVSPHLAYDTEATIAEARKLWRAVNRPNVMIKVPGTEAGLPAIEQLISEGISINITLLFGLGRYERVAAAYLAGLEKRAARGESALVPSVASFFLSRIDVIVDAEIDRKRKAEEVEAALAMRLRGQAAIASARLAYQLYKQIFDAERMRRLEQIGGRPQRVLWASTSTKDPAYTDTYYVDALIGDMTIDTVPIETFEAYRDHGQPALRLEQNLDQAKAVMADLPKAGIDLLAVTNRLEQEGVRKFIDSYERLLQTIGKRREATLGRSGTTDATL